MMGEYYASAEKQSKVHDIFDVAGTIGPEGKE